jgi:hypothetical protein
MTTSIQDNQTTLRFVMLRVRYTVFDALISSNLVANHNKLDQFIITTDKNFICIPSGPHLDTSTAALFTNLQ